MDDFLNGDENIDILKVPGIGPKAKEVLAEKGITIIPHLLAKYMSMAQTEEEEDTDGNAVTGIDVFSTNQQFWHFLQDAGVNSMRSGIVMAVNKKVSQTNHCFVDTTDYEE